MTPLKLTKKEQAELASHVDGIRSREATVRAAIDAYNKTMADEWATLQDVLSDYDGAVDDANNWTAGVHERIQDAFNERSEKWQESEKGASSQLQIAEWEEQLEQIDMSEPSAIEMPDMDAADKLEAMPEDVGGES